MTAQQAPVDLAQIESVCRQLYQATDPASRAAAEAAFKFNAPTNEAVQQCRYLLDNSSSPFAQV